MICCITVIIITFFFVVVVTTISCHTIIIIIGNYSLQNQTALGATTRRVRSGCRTLTTVTTTTFVRKWTRGLAAGTGHITTSAVVSSTGTSPDSRVPGLSSLAVTTRPLSQSNLHLPSQVRSVSACTVTIEPCHTYNSNYRVHNTR